MQGEELSIGAQGKGIPQQVCNCQLITGDRRPWRLSLTHVNKVTRILEMSF